MGVNVQTQSGLVGFNVGFGLDANKAGVLFVLDDAGDEAKVLHVFAPGQWLSADVVAVAAGPSSGSSAPSTSSPSTPDSATSATAPDVPVASSSPADSPAPVPGDAERITRSNLPADSTPVGPTATPAADAPVGPGVVTPAAQDSMTPSATPSSTVFGGDPPVVVDPAATT